MIFSEPSANLDYETRHEVRRQIEELKNAEGFTVLVADHRCFYLRGLIDRCQLLNDNTVTGMKVKRLTSVVIALGESCKSL